MKNLVRWPLLICFVLLGFQKATAAGAHPAPHPELVVFGDSLSSGGANGIPATGPAPTPTNGNYLRQTWIQQLSPMIGLGPLVNYDEPGGTNYAIGGDTTTQMVQQVDRYLLDVLAVSNPSALYVLWCGGNDIGDTVRQAGEGATIFNISSRLAALNGNATASAQAAVDRMEAQIRRLAATGAGEFLWVNLPDLSKTPAVDYYVDTYGFGLPSVRTAASTALQNASNAFNSRMVTRIAVLHAEFPQITIHVLDSNTKFEDIRLHKEAYGFTNVEQSNTTSNDYLFYDNVHPTSHGHYVIALYALAFFEANGLVPDAFDQWLAARFTSPQRNTAGMAGPVDDPDLDGRANLIEYALGSDPLQRDSSPAAMATHSIVGGLDRLSLTFTRAKSAVGAACLPEVSDDLVRWDRGDGFVELVSTEDLGDAERLTYRCSGPAPENGRKFMRLAVQRSP